MALIKCPECGKEISDKAKACPNCGYPLDSKSDLIFPEEKYLKSHNIPSDNQNGVTENKHNEVMQKKLEEYKKSKEALSENAYSNNKSESYKKENGTSGDTYNEIMQSQIEEYNATKRKNSKLSIISFICFWTVIGIPISICLAIYDLSKGDDEHKHGFSIAAILLSVFLLLAWVVDGQDSEEQKADIKEQLIQDREEENKKDDVYSNITLDAKYKDNFIHACRSCGINPENVKNIIQVEDWANGERFQFDYKSSTHTAYFFDNGKLSSINYRGNADIKLYEYGFKSLKIEDFEVDLGTYATLQTACEDVVKLDLTHPSTADFNWFTTGGCSRRYDYYMIGCNFTAQNFFGVKDEHYFVIHSIVNEDSNELVYYELDGEARYGEPQVPEIEKVAVSSASETNTNVIKLAEGTPCEYAKADLFDGEEYTRYYIPAGKYIAKCETRNSAFVIESIELHKEDGFDTATIRERISFDTIESSHEIEIKDGECISLLFQSIILLELIE